MTREDLQVIGDRKVITTAALGSGVALVAASTAALPFVRGYGTTLFQFVWFSAAAIIEAATSNPSMTDRQPTLWLIALVINLTTYLAPLVLAHLCMKRASVGVRVGAIFVWTAFYLAALFILFPATDGP